VRWSKSYSVACGIFVLSAAVLAWCLVPTTNAGEGKGASVVKASATATNPDTEGRQDITIQLDIKEGYRILANPVQNADLDAVQTTVTIASAKKLQDVKIEYPPGKRKALGRDEYFYVYEGKIKIKAFVKRSEGDTTPLDATIRCFPRNEDRVCLPERIKLQIK
jgi:hypothetical protein